MDPAEARKLADYVIENDGSLEQLRERTNEVYRALLKRTNQAPT
jgi:dephospho-CoA kinase